MRDKKTYRKIERSRDRKTEKYRERERERVRQRDRQNNRDRESVWFQSWLSVVVSETKV